MFFNGDGQKVRKGIYLLAVMIALGLPLVLPLRIESSIFIFLVGLATVSYAIAFVLFRRIKRMLSSTATFGYAPTTMYMTGNKAKKLRGNRSSGDEEAVTARKVASGETVQVKRNTASDAGGDNNVHL